LFVFFYVVLHFLLYLSYEACDSATSGHREASYITIGVPARWLAARAAGHHLIEQKMRRLVPPLQSLHRLVTSSPSWRLSLYCRCRKMSEPAGYTPDTRRIAWLSLCAPCATKRAQPPT